MINKKFKSKSRAINYFNNHKKESDYLVVIESQQNQLLNCGFPFVPSDSNKVYYVESEVSLIRNFEKIIREKK